MKKLTAGIFATILGLTTVNAFAATAGTKVASTNYVDGAVAAANAYTDTKVGGIKVPSLDGYAKETWVRDQGYAVASQVATDIATAKSEAAADATTKANAAKDAAIADAATKAGQALTDAKAYVDGITKDMATDTAVAGKLDKSVYEADKPTFATKTDIADMATNTVVAATYATQTSVNDLAGDVNENATAITNLQTADTALGKRIDEVVANAYNDTEVRGLISGNATAISTLQTEQGTQNTAIAKAQADATQAIADAQAEQDVNIQQQSIIDNLDTTYVKVTDIVDTYPATQAAQQ